MSHKAAEKKEVIFDIRWHSLVCKDTPPRLCIYLSLAAKDIESLHPHDWL
jgi:hypothetical protein